MKGTAYYKASVLAKQVLKEVRLMQDNVLEALDATQLGGEDKETKFPPQQQANSASTSVQMEILKTLHMMHGEIAALQKGNKFCQETTTEDPNTKESKK